MLASTARRDGPTMSDVALVRERVQTYLTQQGPIVIDDNGNFTIQYGSTRVIIQVVAHPDENATAVIVSASMLFQVPLTAELYRHVATHADDWWFGHVYLVEAPDGTTGTIVARHLLLGDYLDKEELMYAINGVGNSADATDEQLQTLFGGKRYEDT